MHYYEYLSEKPLSQLTTFNRDKRMHILKALISLSKFLGMYPQFKERMQAFGIKWQMPSALEVFNHMLTKSNEDVSKWAKEIALKFPEFKDFLTLAELSGLRKEETLNAYNLIIEYTKENRLNEYYNEETSCLEHFRLPKIFVRPTKNAFVTIIPKELLQSIAKNQPLTYAIISKRLQRNGFKIKIGLLRSAWATFMQKHLSQAEVDLLQGRVNQTIFMRYYFAPNFIELKQRTLHALEQFAKANLKVLA